MYIIYIGIHRPANDNNIIIVILNAKYVQRTRVILRADQ